MSDNNKPVLRFFKLGEKKPAKDVIAALTSTDQGQNNALAILHDAKAMGVGVDVLLQMQVAHVGEGRDRLSGLEATFQALDIPLNIQDNAYAHAVFAANTSSFITNPGLKPLLPVLINNILRAQKNAVVLERVEDLIAQTRLVNGSAVNYDIIMDKNTADSYGTFRVSEGAQIPRRTIKTTNTNAVLYKHGSGIEMSYEVARRISPDALVPMANRIAYERSQSEAAGAVETLIDGDGNRGAATTETLQTYDGKATGKLRDRAEGVIKWLMAAAKAGRPIDTLVVNWDTLFELAFMFPVQNTANVGAVGIGGVASTTPITMNVKFAQNLTLPLTVVLSNSIGANQMLGYRVGETMERLIEIGSQIEEQEKSITNQMLIYVNSTNSGFSYAYDQSRRLLTWTPA